MICDVCGKEYDHYGGIHDANMIDFRWMGFAKESVTVTRYAVCAECRDAIEAFIGVRHEAATFARHRELAEREHAADVEYLRSVRATEHKLQGTQTPPPRNPPPMPEVKPAKPTPERARAEFTQTIGDAMEGLLKAMRREVVNDE